MPGGSTCLGARRVSLFVFGLALALVLSALSSAEAQHAATNETPLGRRLETSDPSAENILFIRIFKEDGQLELWIQRTGRSSCSTPSPSATGQEHWGPSCMRAIDRRLGRGFLAFLSAMAEDERQRIV
jgi:hypothetical protein